MRKILVLIVVMLVCLTGCNTSPSVDEGSKENANVSTSTPAPEVTKVEKVENENNEKEDASDDELHNLMKQPVSKDVSGWTMSVESCMIGENLHNVNVILGYSNVETKEVDFTAPDGKEYCLLKCSFNKGKTKEAIEWDKLELKDDKGNSYKRITDAFLEDFGLIRMPGTKLNFGKNEGWIAFEINKGERVLSLNYPFEAETYEQLLDIGN